jgi:hypothetical protein
MAQVIEKTQIDAYIDFVAKYPDIKIGQRTFDKLKPFFVRPASENDRNTSVVANEKSPKQCLDLY